MTQTLSVFAVGVLALLGIYLLVQRGREAAQRRGEPFKRLDEVRTRTQNDRFIEKLLREDASQPSDAAAIERTFRNLFFTTADRGRA